MRRDNKYPQKKKNMQQGYKVISDDGEAREATLLWWRPVRRLCAMVMSTKQERSGYKDVDTDLHRSDDN